MKEKIFLLPTKDKISMFIYEVITTKPLNSFSPQMYHSWITENTVEEYLRDLEESTPHFLDIFIFYILSFPFLYHSPLQKYVTFSFQKHISWV